MTDFDTQVRPLLHRIVNDATATAVRASYVAQDVHNLPARPQWPTKAEEALEEAEQSIARALTLVRQARAHYRKVVVEHV